MEVCVCVCVVEVVMGGSGKQIDGNRMFHEMARQMDTHAHTSLSEPLPCLAISRQKVRISVHCCTFF